MTARQRKLLLAIAEHWRNWASSPSVHGLSEIVGMCDSAALEELYRIERLGFIEFFPGSFAGSDVRLTKKAEELIPRVRELQ